MLLPFVRDMFAEVEQLPAFTRAASHLRESAGRMSVTGLSSAAKALIIVLLRRTVERPFVLVVADNRVAEDLLPVLRAFCELTGAADPDSVVTLPARDVLPFQNLSPHPEIQEERATALWKIATGRAAIVISPVTATTILLRPPEYYADLARVLRRGESFDLEKLLEHLNTVGYSATDVVEMPGQYAARGGILDVYSPEADRPVRVEFFGDEIERITRFEPLTGNKIELLDGVVVFPAKQFVTTENKMRNAILTIREELGDRINLFERSGKLLEAQRIKQRTEFDLEMMEEMGVCSGIENYSRHISGRPPGSQPNTLFDFLPDDYLLVIDESHATVPQIGGMYEGDKSRKTVLVEHGFRLPSALDNRPLNFLEFQSMQNQTIYVSATPAPRELGWSQGHVAELVVRPTGLIDPTITLKPLKGQIDDLLEEVRKRADKKERTLVTTLTKRTAEELTDYLRDIGVRVQYLHSEIDAIERVEILRSLRKGEFDVLVGINLLREGLDLPEVSLVAILDADKEGFLRSETSLIQTAGRAARHLNGEVILYADVMTQSIQKFLAVTKYRRERQIAYNVAHNITPRSVVRAVEESLATYESDRREADAVLREGSTDIDITSTIQELETEMLKAAEDLKFEKAALLRDQIKELKHMLDGTKSEAKPVSYRKSKRARK